LVRDDSSPEGEGSSASIWAVLARTAAALGRLTNDPAWMAENLEPSPRVGVWTDDFHNLLAVFDKRETWRFRDSLRLDEQPGKM
jgi:hypothetical protein